MSNASLELGGDNWAAKDGNLLGYAVGDSSGKYVPREFTFTRGSNLAATRVAANGLIEKGRENLLTQSNNFSSSDWMKFGSPTLTSGQSGYDGSNNAWLYESTTISHSMLQLGSFNGVYTWSVYAKAGTADGIRLRLSASTDTNIYVNLTDGSIITDQSGITYNIESVGSGWYRVSITSNASPHTDARIIVVDNVGASTTGTIYIQDAQLEIGLVATDYIETGASTVQAGLLEDEPRIDYTGGTKSLLLEPSRTNLIGQSEYFDSWNKVGSPTITNNYGISPEGVQNSTRFETTSDRILYSVTTINADETFSIYMRGSGTLRMNIGSDNFYPSVTSDWVRYEFKTTQVGSQTNVQIRGNGSAVDVELYGAQYERNDYATSYIPTYGSSATRSADNAANTDTIDADNDFTLMIESRVGSESNTGKFFDGLGYLNINDIGNLRFRYNSTNYSESGDFTQTFKWLLRKNSTKMEIFLNGTKLSDSITILPTGSADINFENGYTKQFIVFPTALSDADCITLTTL